MTTHVLVTEAGDRLALVSCTIRNTGSGWAIITGSGHQPTGVTTVTQATDHLVLNHPVGADFVISLAVTVDETYAKSGLRCGASVGYDYSEIYLYSGAAGSAALDPATVVSSSGNLWIQGYFHLPPL